MSLPTLPYLDYDPFKDKRIESGMVDWSKIELEKLPGKKKPSQISNPPFSCEASIAKVKKVYLIYNFFGGDPKLSLKTKEAALRQFEEKLNSNGIEVEKVMTQRSGHATELCKNWNGDLETTSICIWGGDGSVGEAVNGLMQRSAHDSDKIKLAIVCAGTGNALGMKIKLFTNSKQPLLDRALLTADAIVNGKTQSWDIGKVTSATDPTVPPAYFALILMYGNAVEFMADSEYLRRKWKMGAARYPLTMIYRIFWKNYERRPDLRLIVDESHVVEFPPQWRKPFKRNVSELTVCNVSTVGIPPDDYQMSPLAQADDGKFECMCQPRMSKAELRKSVVAAQHARSYVEDTLRENHPPMYLRFSKLQIEMIEQPNKGRKFDSLINVDGETLPHVYFPKIEIQCMKHALTIFVP